MYKVVASPKLANDALEFEQYVTLNQIIRGVLAERVSELMSKGIIHSMFVGIDGTVYDSNLDDVRYIIEFGIDDKPDNTEEFLDEYKVLEPFDVYNPIIPTEKWAHVSFVIQ